MKTRDKLVKVRKIIAESKIYINRTQTYMAPFQLFMIFLIFLNTTVWNIISIQIFFGSKMSFICVEKCTDCFGVGHINMFSPMILRCFLEQNGFKVLMCKNHGIRGGGFKDRIKDIRDFLGLGPLVFCIAQKA